MMHQIPDGLKALLTAALQISSLTTAARIQRVCGGRFAGGRMAFMSGRAAGSRRPGSVYIMDDCCGFSRRQFSEFASAAAAVPAQAVSPECGSLWTAAPSGTDGSGLYVQDLELVTVTDTSFILTWHTADGPEPAMPYGPGQQPGPVVTDGLVRYGTDPGRLDCEAREPGASTAYHYVEVTGLRPGSTYYYQALSGGVAAAPRLSPRLTCPPGGMVSPADPADPRLADCIAGLLSSGVVLSASPGSVTTLVPPTGSLLLTVALCNDVHIGETVSGLAAGDFPPGFSQAPDLPPYPVVMAESMVADATARGADVLVVAGDLTAAAQPGQVTASRELLDRFGRLTVSGRLSSGGYVVARGNHDQHGCPDSLADVYGLPQGTLTSTEVGGLRLIGLDTTTGGTPGGAIGTDQFAMLHGLLAGQPDQPTLVFGHHPVTEESAFTMVAGPSFGLDRGDAARLEALYSAAPGVFLHHAGHTHRNLRTSSPLATGVEFLEVAAAKEYPGGFALLRVYQGGYMVNFYKSSSPLARQWSQTTSCEYLGLYPAYTIGSLTDRNHSVVRDLTAVSPLPGRRRLPVPPNSGQLRAAHRDAPDPEHVPRQQSEEDRPSVRS
jgi:3',5'-cyclic-AMP phosphodiesterase